MPISTLPIDGGNLIRLDPETGKLRGRGYLLQVTAGPDAGKSIPMNQAVRVGTHPEAELCLSDPTVSRFHVELEPRADGVRIRDLGSRNGTFSGGMKIEAVLVTGEAATVELGKTVLKLAVEERDLDVSDASDCFGNAIGRSAAMRKLFGVLARVSSTDSTVVLLGETGTGKEVLAEAIHQSSPRKRKQFRVFDCAGVAPTLIESELFGHVKGAFTGAVVDRAGAFLDADGGTLFLDEVGELPLELQPKLLRVLEAGTVKRVGDEKQQRVNVRIVAATHRDLRAEVKAGKFRQDLYYRLGVVEVKVPALRERLEDLPLLAKSFMKRMGRAEVELTPPLIARLSAYSWPGNVRELRNVIERALASGSFEAMPLDDGDGPTPSGITDLPYKEAKEKLVDAFTRNYVKALLEQYDGNVAKAARVSGIHRNYLWRLVGKYGFKKPTEAE